MWYGDWDYWTVLSFIQDQRAARKHNFCCHFMLAISQKSLHVVQEVTKQLTLAAEAFLDGPDGCDIDMAKKTVKLSMIFSWYKEDFGSNNEEVGGASACVFVEFLK